MFEYLLGFLKDISVLVFIISIFIYIYTLMDKLYECIFSNNNLNDVNTNDCDNVSNENNKNSKNYKISFDELLDKIYKLEEKFLNSNLRLE